MDGISFDSGLSGISRLQRELVDNDFPKFKSAFKTSGDNVVAYTWRALEYGKTFENREMRFALSLSDHYQVLTPDEHNAMTISAINTFQQYLKDAPEMTAALAVLTESMELRQALQISRNVLHAA
ncbi:MAG: hypothetical protein PUP46_01760 [Endozoicomonas sp. (ex Botrylloides leachii)]|nr:hypothetical protein [Endozoicomonas sp. (ex Botrylloides leachii)]